MVERVNPDMAKRPQLIQGDSQTLFAGVIGPQENCMLNLFIDGNAFGAVR